MQMESKKEKVKRQDLSWLVVNVSVFDTSHSLEKIIKEKQDEGYELAFFSVPWMMFKRK